MQWLCISVAVLLLLVGGVCLLFQRRRKAIQCHVGTAQALDPEVQFTVYRPAVVAPEVWIPLLVFTHLSELPPDAPADALDPLEEVQRQAQAVLRERVKDYRQLVGESAQPVPRSGVITLVPMVQSIEFNPPERVFRWEGEVQREEFKLRAPARLDGHVASGSLFIYFGSIVLAEVTLNLRISSQLPSGRSTAYQQDKAKRFRRIFASYSHKDAPIVEQFEGFAKAVGDEFLRDVSRLQAGELWGQRLEEMIRQADIFQLFWSRNSMFSPFVSKEWHYALSLKRPNFIRPVFWEEPLPASEESNLPPLELRRLHFQRIRFRCDSTSTRPPPSSPPRAVSDEPDRTSGDSGEDEQNVTPSLQRSESIGSGPSRRPLEPLWRRANRTRLIPLTLLLVLCLAGLSYRLIDLQFLRHDELSAMAQRNTQREFLLEPRRGDILDVKGNLLATSILVKTVCADPVLIGNRQADVARSLAPLLQASEDDLRKRLMPRFRQNAEGEAVTNRYVVLKRNVPVETWQRIQMAMKNLSFGLDERILPHAEQVFYRDLRRRAIYAEKFDDQQRVYPNQALAAHVLGYVGMDEREVDGRRLLETSGKDGIERRFDATLAGVRGWRLTETNRPGREVVPLRERDMEPHDGLNVVLTIDAVLQHIVKSSLAEASEKYSPTSVSCVVVRPRTGEILAMAALPDYNPNNAESAPPEARRNGVICDLFEPGPALQIVVVSGALNEQLVTLTNTFDCGRSDAPYADAGLGNHDSHGVLTVEDIVAKSSSIGSAKIAMEIGALRLESYVRAFGFGKSTGIELPDEEIGNVPPSTDWDELLVSRISMGRGITVTPMQMVMAMCVIANKGYLMRPMMVQRLEDRQGNVVSNYSPQRVRRVINDTTTTEMVRAMTTVVSPSATSTAPMAVMGQYLVVGKTDTGQKVNPSGGLLDTSNSSFVGFFPAYKPELCIYVGMDGPSKVQDGSQAVVMLFKQIADKAANLLMIRPSERVAEPGSQQSQSNSPPRGKLDPTIAAMEFASVMKSLVELTVVFCALYVSLLIGERGNRRVSWFDTAGVTVLLALLFWALPEAASIFPTDLLLRLGRPIVGFCLAFAFVGGGLLVIHYGLRTRKTLLYYGIACGALFIATYLGKIASLTIWRLCGQ